MYTFLLWPLCPPNLTNRHRKKGIPKPLATFPNPNDCRNINGMAATLPASPPTRVFSFSQRRYRATVFNISALWGGARNARDWVEGVAPT